MTRTDDDSWDLASSVGSTATAAAAGRALASRQADPLISDPFAEPLVRAVGVDFYTRVARGELDPAHVDAGHDDLTFGLGRMCDMMAARTRYFDSFASDAVDAGIRQLVILASGLDARAYRQQWPAGTTLYEIDQPEVIEFKTETLAQLGASPTVEHRPVAVDLREDWPAALQGAGFNPDWPSAWIAEGLLPFLPPDDQDRLLDNITVLSAPMSRVAAENIPANLAQVSVRLTAATKHWRAHGLDKEWADLWYTGERNDVAEYLARCGWRTLTSSGSELLAANGLFGEPHGQDRAAILNSLAYVHALRE